MKVNMTAASQVEPIVERLGIEYMADELERSIDELLMEFGQLESRLYPILDESPPPEVDRANEPPRHGSPLAGRAYENSLRIRALTDRITHLICRMS